MGGQHPGAASGLIKSPSQRSIPPAANAPHRCTLSSGHADSAQSTQRRTCATCLNGSRITRATGSMNCSPGTFGHPRRQGPSARWSDGPVTCPTRRVRFVLIWSSIKHRIKTQIFGRTQKNAQDSRLSCGRPAGCKPRRLREHGAGTSPGVSRGVTSSASRQRLDSILGRHAAFWTL